MAAIDDAKTIGRARLDFASEHDIDEFVEMLARFESGEMPADQWRRFRLVRGTYGQRQDGVQMLRVKAPQGIVSSSQMRAFAGVASRYSRGFCHITTRQNIQFHFVLLKNVEAAMRELADEGLTTREACGNSVRNITGCPYAGTSDTEIFDPSPYAEALTRYFLRHPLSGVLPRKFKIAFEGCADDHAVTAINDIGWRARIVDGRKGFKVTVAGGTSILPVTGYRAVRLSAGRADARSGGSGRPRVPQVRRLQASAAEPDEVRHPRDRVGCVSRALRRGARRLPPRRRCPPAIRSRQGDGRGCARLGARCAADTAGGGRDGGDADARSRRASRHGAAPAAAGCLPPLDETKRQQAAAGRVLPRHRAPAAWRLHGGSDARARGSRRSVRRRRRCA